MFSPRSTFVQHDDHASYFNVNCDSINNSLFQEKLKCCYENHGNTLGFILIFSDDIQMKDSTNIFKPYNKPQYFWEHFSENDIKMSNGTGRMYPVLELYLGCNVMPPTNFTVSMGQANRS
jgi:hypothetical protein